MINEIAVVAVFMLTVVLFIYHILKKPNLRIGNYTVESYAVVPLIGPILLIIFRLMDFSSIISGLKSYGESSPVGILVLFMSMVFMSIYLDNVGFIEYLARKALLVAGHDGTKLFLAVYGVVSVLTIFTSNDIIILTLTPFIYYFAKHAKINPKPLLFAEFFAANTWSMMLYIGNPTNVFVSSAFGIKFFEYSKWMFLPTIAGGIVNLGVLHYFFKNDIDVHIIKSHIKPEEAIKDKRGAIIGVAMLSFCILGLAVAPYFRFQMWHIALLFAFLLVIILGIRDLIRTRNNGCSQILEILRKLPYGIIPFVLSFFILVNALNKYNVLGIISDTLQSPWIGPPGYIIIFGILSALFANILNNIPMTVAFTAIIANLEGKSLLASALAVVVGSNLGANLTPIGALAGIMWMSILKDKECHISFSEFVKYGIIVTSYTLVATLGVLAIEFLLF